jgi:hypothetical protein
VIKRKMSNWKLKRTGHRGLPASTQRPADAITIVAATKPAPPAERNARVKPKSAVLPLDDRVRTPAHITT